MEKLNDSGQMILISAFVISISFLVISIMLNNIIFASNTASESGIETNVFDSSNILKTTVEAYQKAYDGAGRGQNFDEDKFDAYMLNYSSMMARSYALTGTIFSLNDGSFDEAYFSHNGLKEGDDEWTVVRWVNSTDTFLMSLNMSKVADESNKFVIQVIDQSNNILWSAKLFNSNNQINVTIENSTEILDSKISSTAELNITDNKIGNTFFDFHFNSQTSGKRYMIKFINGSSAAGTFLISGDLISGDAFEIERLKVMNCTVVMNKRGHVETNVTIPIILPGGHI
jgi:hypothetical protein